MSDIRIITPKKGYFTFCLREEYVELCEGNHCAAMVLSQHEYWHKNRIGSRQQAKAHNEGAERKGQPPTQDTSLWVYKSHVQMQAELLGLFGEKAIGLAYKVLIAYGFVTTRFNPKQKWDRRPQYLFMVDAVQNAIDALPNRYVQTEGEVTAESTPQKCGVHPADLRSPSRNDAESSPRGCGVSKETSSENTQKIHQRVAPAGAQSFSPSLSQISDQSRPEQTLALTSAEEFITSIFANTLKSVPVQASVRVTAPAQKAEQLPERLDPNFHTPIMAAYRKSRAEMSKEWFIRQYGRPSNAEDWMARAREIVAEAEAKEKEAE